MSIVPNYNKRLILMLSECASTLMTITNSTIPGQLHQHNHYLELKVTSPFTVITISLIKGSALALHCCKAHARIIKKTGNLTPYKTALTPENFSSRLCTRDYVWDTNYCAKFGGNRFSESISPSRWNITPLWLSWLSCPVFFFSGTCPGRTVGLIFMLDGSNDVFPRKEMPFGG